MTPAPIDRTIAVYGALRSGTTMLRLMLNGHPRFNCPGEMDFVVDHLDANGSYDMEALAANRIWRAHEALFPDTPLPANPRPDDFIARVAGDDDVAVLILHRHLERAMDLFPGLRVIHLVRDPRDVARSSIGMGWAGNVYYGVDHWIGTMRDWQTSLPKLPEAQRLVVAYEDLIAEPEKTLSAICSFSGLSFDPEMLEYDRDSSYSKPDTSLTVQWKRKQSPREVGLVEAKIGELMTVAGYTPSGHPPVHPNALERAQLWAQNSRKKWASQFSRYGVKDPVILAVAAKLNLKPFARAAQRRVDEAQKDYLK